MRTGDLLAERAAAIQRQHSPPGGPFLRVGVAGDPDLARRHHHGEAGEPEPPPAEPEFHDPAPCC